MFQAISANKETDISLRPIESFQRHGPGLRKRLHPAVQFVSRCSVLTFLVDLPARIFHAIADRFLVNIQPDLIHMSLRSLRGCSLNQRSP
jgi:hypothetical protein